ncbi:flagellar biosynthesis protein FlgD [Campylobacter sp. RM12327]|uniref:flagellar hook capping FlgD N-terminal domain-containing protein n=1 Tax=Campylobacter sputorum TaxID=206 RepID=UPI000B7790E2|nr:MULTISPECIES: flagellar hook capping FlgD N-terminal domain-containing protein [Campylobacter]ASM39437.1 flagellar hook assembly protein [Campylobacter sputorum]MBE7358906.1 flagellar biosynthesis protein FlgD [Campylobacter sp. RM11302]MBF6670003.1 flagellar biosynthesis protein FlgD [Campylobacter sp. RM12327]MBF6674229.1 flagellar biosynthesis protein FlgD [Campylobacter sp. RM13538]MBF6676654.1 flagellar biosynthesis protein FlgD [Campylobacter sp. RM12321]
MAIDTSNMFTQDKVAAQKAQEASEKAGVSNPKAALDKDAFMKLLLTELKYQDPTSPMDTAKMLEQTSQLATLETQENTNKMMKDLAAQMKAMMSMNSFAALGTMAHTASDAVVKDTMGSDINFSIYFPDVAKSGVYEIYDSTGSKLINSISFGNAPKGTHEVTWDGKDDDGNEAPLGAYRVKAKYITESGEQKETSVGTYPVEAIRFIDGKAEVKIGGKFIDISKISEFYKG